VSNLLVGLVGALLATNQPAAVSNLVHQYTGARVEITDPNDPVEKEFKQVMDADDAAQAEVDEWIQTNQKFAAKGAGESDAALNRRILARFEPVRKAYDDFLARHTNHARAHLAYAGFLQDIFDEEAAVPHMEKAREIDPRNPAPWNNLANHYGHYGDVKKSFAYYAKAIELDPTESVYFQNFGTTVYLFRKDAMEFYDINEQQVFDKAMDLYAKARKLDPQDFPLATDLAQSYYGIRPFRTNDAFVAWTNAFNIARDDIEREGVHVHFARLNWMIGRTNEARLHLNAITNEMYAEIKDRLTRNLTNAPPDRSTPLSSIPERAPGKLKVE
jgi:tetratricopeptide (TPR) repeat protein